MSKKNFPEHTLALGPKALEMVMRDVLGGMEELSLMKNHKTAGGVFQVISIDPLEEEKLSQDTTERLATPPSTNQSMKASIIQINKFRTQTNKKE